MYYFPNIINPYRFIVFTPISFIIIIMALLKVSYKYSTINMIHIIKPLAYVKIGDALLSFFLWGI